MELIFGGAYQGKTEYAKKKYGNDGVQRLNRNDPSPVFRGKIIDCIEEFVYACISKDKDPVEYLEQHRTVIDDKALICRDISMGIVPVDKGLRTWREQTGRVMVYLAGEADTVTRIFCGLGQKVK